MQDVEEMVIVTIPDRMVEPVSTVEGEEDGKNVLVTTEFTQQPGEDALTIAPAELEADSSSTDLSKEESVYVKLTEDVDVDSDIFYPITCGDTKAILVWKKFVCPGINIKCVQLNEQLISPKEFVCLAGKSTLKDWKRAIRLNGTMLRKIMDSGELDFYQHPKVCSNTCRSTKIDLVGSKVAVTSQHSVTPSSSLNGLSPPFPDTEESSEWVTAIGEDSVVFWCGIKEAGLLDEVVTDFQKELNEVLGNMQERASKPPLLVKDAVLLNDIVQNFGMLDLVKKVLASHKSQMDHYREQYTQSLAALEQQCDEHRKRAKELKSKAQHLNNVLMTLTPVAPPPAPKRQRLSRALSGPTASPTQITLSLNQLTGLPLGKVLTVASTPPGTNLSGYTVFSSGAVTSPVTAPELAPDSTNLTMLSTAAGVQDVTGTNVTGTTSPMAFVKVVTPQYQLVTLPPSLGATLQGLGITQNAVVCGTNNSLVSSMAVHTQVKPHVVNADTEICSYSDIHKVDVSTESEEENIKD